MYIIVGPSLYYGFQFKEPKEETYSLTYVIDFLKKGAFEGSTDIRKDKINDELYEEIHCNLSFHDLDLEYYDRHTNSYTSKIKHILQEVLENYKSSPNDSFIPVEEILSRISKFLTDNEFFL